VYGITPQGKAKVKRQKAKVKTPGSVALIING
jgi:hypothetical protein